MWENNAYCKQDFIYRVVNERLVHAMFTFVFLLREVSKTRNLDDMELLNIRPNISNAAWTPNGKRADSLFNSFLKTKGWEILRYSSNRDTLFRDEVES